MFDLVVIVYLLAHMPAWVCSWRYNWDIRMVTSPITYVKTSTPMVNNHTE